MKSECIGKWQIFTVVSAHVVVFWVIPPEDGGSKDLWNVGILPQNYTVS